MAHTQSLSLLPRQAHSVPCVELRQSLSIQVASISPYVDQLMRFILNFRNADGSEVDIEMALHEVLANAVVHGNAEDPCKHVYLACRCYTDGEVWVTVRDQGRGFEGNVLGDLVLPDNRLLTYGRGIYLMTTLMDEISFEEGGCVVRMRKNSNSTAPAQRRSG